MCHRELRRETATMDILTTTQKKALNNAADAASSKGWPLVFIKRLDEYACHKLGMRQGFEIRVNGKPFSKKGYRSGSIRTCKFEVVTDLLSLCDYIHACAEHATETEGLYGVNILIDMPTTAEEEEYSPDTDLTQREVAQLMSDLRDQGVLECKGLWDICAGSWDNKLHTQDTEG